MVHNNPEADVQSSYAHAAWNYKTDREPVLLRLRVTLLGFCLWVIVNEKPLNLEKTTISFLFVILINLYIIGFSKSQPAIQLMKNIKQETIFFRNLRCFVPSLLSHVLFVLDGRRFELDA